MQALINFLCIRDVPTPARQPTPAPILIGAFDLNDVAVCLEVMAGNGCLGLIRVPLDSDTRKAFARRCLDAGAIGVCVSAWGEELEPRF